MIYLLSEMILALAVAVILGMALGWIIYRSAHVRQTRQIKQVLSRKSVQLGQAQSDIAMLTEDYDELHRNSQEQIDLLRKEAQQIPTLTSNLEKSQLLVRQMMQRHEAKLRDLATENQRLVAKLNKLNNQENLKNQLAAKLDEHKRQQAGSMPVSSESSAVNRAEVTQLPSTHDKHREPLTNKPAVFAAVESDDDPFDTVIEVAGEMQLELDETAEDKTVATINTLPSADSNEPDIADSAFELNDASALEGLRSPDTFVNDLPSTDFDDSRSSTDESNSMTSTVELDDTSGFTDATADETIVDEQQMDAFMSARKHYADSLDTEKDNYEIPLDGSGDAAKLFEPVDHHDDLQQIFGIGPLTEKALNELGITSYSQLAELQQHDIQRIADALEIGQGRIERDNWVGNARRQLEEVLEQL